MQTWQPLLRGLATYPAYGILTHYQHADSSYIYKNTKQLQKDVLVPNQGVYTTFVQSACGQIEAYIESSYGRQGMKNRILKNHLNPHYRSKDPFKALYIELLALPAERTNWRSPSRRGLCAPLFSAPST